MKDLEYQKPVLEEADYGKFVSGVSEGGDEKEDQRPGGN